MDEKKTPYEENKSKECICFLCDGKKDCKSEDKYKVRSCNNYALIYRDIKK